MTTPAEYTPEQLHEAARQARAWAEVVRKMAALHEARAVDLPPLGKHVALALADASRASAEHAIRLAADYELAAATCP